MGLLSKIKNNLGSGTPPMISLQGNRFTLRDAAGNEKPGTTTLNVVLVDGNPNISKVWREDKNYNPNDPTPPDCWSDNGVAPSSFALKPQCDECARCQWNIRGSATSKVSGKPIKACEDRQKLAVIVADDPSHMLFQLQITPGSLSNFRGYIRSLEGHKYEAEEVVTRLSFADKATGIVEFDAVAAVEDDMRQFIASLEGNPQLAYVTGETDQPRSALPPAQAQPRIVQLPPDNEEPPKSTGPTQADLEATLRRQREEKLAAAKKPNVVDMPARTAPLAQKEVPAFLRRGTTKGEIVSDPPPPPDDVQALIDQQQTTAPLEDRLKKAFNLPLRR